MSLFQIIIPLNISTQNYFGLKVIAAVSKSINSRDKFFTHSRYLFKTRWEVMSSYSNYKVIMKKSLAQITWVLNAIYPSLIAREVSSLFLTSEITPLFNFCCKLFLKIHYLESSVLKKYVIFSFLFFFLQFKIPPIISQFHSSISEQSELHMIINFFLMDLLCLLYGDASKSLFESSFINTSYINS